MVERSPATHRSQFFELDESEDDASDRDAGGAGPKRGGGQGEMDEDGEEDGQNREQVDEEEGEREGYDEGRRKGRKGLGRKVTRCTFLCRGAFLSFLSRVLLGSYYSVAGDRVSYAL